MIEEPREPTHAELERSIAGLNDLRKNLLRKRTLLSAICSVSVVIMTILAVTPLFSVLAMLFYRGVQAFDWEFFTTIAPAMGETGGGIGNAIVGSVVMVAIAAVISIPTGILGAIYLTEVGADSKLANQVRFAAKVLTGLPSIIAGIFIFGLLVATFGNFSAWAGGAALSILMLPMILLTSEEAIKMVPSKMREAAYGMGCTREQVIRKVLLPTALPGILTGIMLALARALGETAPLLFTARYANNSWVYEGYWRLHKPTQSLAMFIYENRNSIDDNLDEAAWGAALVLVLLVLIFNLAGQLISFQAGRHKQR